MMTRSDVRAPSAAADVVALLRELVVEVRGLRRDMARSRTPGALVAAIGDYFGPGRFTVAGLLDIADDPAMAAALADLIDLDAPPRSRSTALGALLARLPEVEIVAEARGAAVYRLRTSPPEVRKVHGDVR